MSKKEKRPKKITVEISSDVAKDLRSYLKENFNYKYQGSDIELIQSFIDSIETLPENQLIEVLLGDCSPEQLL